jgi:hypothetical protein
MVGGILWTQDELFMKLEKKYGYPVEVTDGEDS